MPNLLKRLKKEWKYGTARTAVAAVCAHSVSISIGICQGYSAILIPQLNGSHEFNIDATQSSWLASLGAITNPIGSILSGLLAEWFGRKRAIQISSLPLILGWFCIGFATDIDWLYAGRLVTGIAAGMSTASYTYVSEISTAENRGIFQAMGPVSASFGILFTYTLGALIKWDTLALISLIFSFFTMIVMYFLPESPSYLMRKGDSKAAFKNLIWFRRNNALAQNEYQKYLKMNATTSGKIANYCTGSTLKPFGILVALFFLQELSGIYSILFYAVNFFKDANIELDEYVSSIIVGAIRFVMSIVAAFLINKYARRKLCMVSAAGMASSLVVMIGYLKYYEANSDQTRTFTSLPLICVLLNVLFSMIGMLPIPWILVGELFPMQVRSIMSGIVICIAQSFIFVCVKLYPDMISYLSFSGTLIVFAVAAVMAFLFSIFCLPETKNKTLEEIEGYFKKNKVREAFTTSAAGVVNKGFTLAEKRNSQHVFTISINR